MQKRLAVITLLSLVVLASGCADSGNKKDETGSITVTSLQVQPQSIYEGNSITASLEVKNTGSISGQIALGRDEQGNINGGNILRNFCPDVFKQQEFSFQPTQLANNGVVNLSEGQRLKMQWRLKHIGNPRLIKEKCTLEFNMPFNYSVSAYRQVQIKQSREVPGSELNWESSSGPMVFAIETIGSASEGQSTFITPGTEQGTPQERVPDKMTVLLQLQNPSGKSRSSGVIDVNEESLRVYATDPLKLNEAFLPGSNDLSQECGEDLTAFGSFYAYRACAMKENQEGLEWGVNGDYSSPRCDIDENDQIRIYDGKSRVIRCQVPVPEKIDSPSKISEIRASIDYTYLKNGGSRTVEVKPRGK